MLSVFICEDNLKQREDLEDTIQKYILIEELAMEVALSTANPEDILTHLKANSHITGLYFLDIDLQHDMNGITLASKIRELDATGKIVFVTTHGELAFLTFTHKIEALDYIIKTNEFEDREEKVRQCLQIAHERYIRDKKVEAKYYKVKINGKIHIIPFHEIMFFETSAARHTLILHLENGRLQYRGTMKEVENYSSEFVRVHHSVVANVQNIKLIDRKNMMLEMRNGETCSASMRGLKALDKRISLKGKGMENA